MARPPLKADDLERIYACRLAGKSILATSKATGVARNTVAKWASNEIVEAMRRVVNSMPSQRVIEQSA